MNEFRDYDITFPELVYDILDYFRVTNTQKEPKNKSVLDYCQTSRFSKQGKLIQPDIVHLISESLSKKGLLVCTKTSMNVFGIDANYIYIPHDDKFFLSKDESLIFSLNCMAYGFPYIYASYKDDVLPVVVKDAKGNIAMGTCFRFRNGILTAKHCLEAAEVYIKGYTAELLRKGDVIISNDNDLDLAYIELGKPTRFVSGDVHVLDEVLVMGYPKIPMFFEFCAAERASISSVPTRGAVASLANQYISRKAGQLMLITARIRGGNSGGPIIDSNGAVVGVAFSEPTAEGNYDEMGYGIAYPINVFDQMLNDYKKMDVNFVDNIQ